MILRHDLPARRPLRSADPILDDLEDDVERWQREYRHHEALDAWRLLEACVREREMVRKGPIELRLSVFVVADRCIELVDSLVRHDLGEIGDGRRWGCDIDVEIRPREAEDHG